MNKWLITSSILCLVGSSVLAAEQLNTRVLAQIKMDNIRTEANISILESYHSQAIEHTEKVDDQNNSPSKTTILAQNKDFYRINKGMLGMFYVVQDFYATGEKRTEPYLVADIEKAKLNDFDILNYDQMSINGLLIVWFNNGQVERKGVFDQGKRKGLWVSWYDNGQKRSSGYYKNGLKEGTWTVWYQTGKRMQKGYFQADRREGVWIYWYGNGKKKEAGRYNDDSRVERWNYWDDKGVLIKSIIKEVDVVEEN